MSRWLILLLFATTLAAQTADTTRFEFATTAAPNGMAGHPYAFTIKLRNGAGPYQFHLTDGLLPPGLHLNSGTGVITGTPLEVGNFRFSLSVRDLGTNVVARHTFVIAIQNQLLLEWLKPPALNSNTIAGSVKVTNSSSEGLTFDTTVIIVAVNEIGKAFALGYQHFNLSPGVEQAIPFSSTVPNGHYNVHVDAIAARPNSTRSSARSSLDTAAPLVVNVNR
jgi:Putative Ig domain